MATAAHLEALQAEAEAEAAAAVAAATVPLPHRWPFGPHGQDWRTERPDAALPPDPRWCEFQVNQGEWEAQLPPAGQLVRLEWDQRDPTVIERCLAALGRDGAVCLLHAVAAETCDQVVADMTPYMRRGSLLDGFFGKRSKRIGALPARTRAADPIVAHPALMKLCDALIGRQVLRMDKQEVAELASKPMASRRGSLQQLPWGLDLTQIITLGPGAEQQILHHDGGYCLWDFHDAFEHKISTVWALSDFTDEAGATRVVLGSQDWARDRVASPADSVASVMPRGSVIIYTGSTIHGSGPNTTPDHTRIGLNVDYNLGLLRTEENQYLSCPPSVMKDAPIYMQRLCGYTKVGSCRSFADYQHPKAALALAAAGGSIDWASHNPWGSRRWGGHTGINAQIMANHLQDQPWRWGAGVTAAAKQGAAEPHHAAGYEGPTAGDREVPPDMMLSAMEPDSRWDHFQQHLAQRVAALPAQAPVSVVWDAENAAAVGEQLIAAIYRDGTAILTGAVSTQTCDGVIADMRPYMEDAAARAANAAARSGVAPDGALENLSTRVTALPARSERSWELITHPAILDVGHALLGRQVLSMSKAELSRRMTGRAKQVPWCMHLSQMVQIEPHCVAQGLHRDSGYLELNLEKSRGATGCRLEYELTTIWALSEFASECAATRLVPGSHRWPQHRVPLESEVVCVTTSYPCVDSRAAAVPVAIRIPELHFVSISENTSTAAGTPKCRLGRSCSSVDRRTILRGGTRRTSRGWG
eukprot:COSAG01_NODE_1799_length_9205_cov_130.191302_7_plen_757_part_00